MANKKNPMQNVTFENVVYENLKTKKTKWYKCENVNGGIAIGNTYPIPHCFNNGTTLQNLQEQDVDFSEDDE